jgi:hypothetical protein
MKRTVISSWAFHSSVYINVPLQVYFSIFPHVCLCILVSPLSFLLLFWNVKLQKNTKNASRIGDTGKVGGFGAVFALSERLSDKLCRSLSLTTPLTHILVGLGAQKNSRNGNVQFHYSSSVQAAHKNSEYDGGSVRLEVQNLKYMRIPLCSSLCLCMNISTHIPIFYYNVVSLCII